VCVQFTIEHTLGAAERAKIPNVIRFFETVSHASGLAEVFGETPYHETAPPVMPAKEKKPAEPKPKAEKAEKPKAEPKPKAEKAPKPKEEDDEEDDGIPKEEPKAKNPLDFLPKSTFNLEDWKRAYSNMDTRGPNGALEWFYKKCVL
jgi:elongation factor 1-gamma